MGMFKFLSSIFILFSIILLIFYWFIPMSTIEFGLKPGNSNFSLYNYGEENMQFYSNMRYSDSKISYKIIDCTLQKKYDMLQAFEIIENNTILEFYETNSDEEIIITCDSKNKIEEGLFIAGEGGPTNITKTDKFSVIHHGKILLIKNSRCERPNVAIHELLHALGFNHSNNKENIMYPVSKCRQTIGEDIIELINDLYQTKSNPDLSFENVSAVMRGKYLDTNISIRNNGLKDSENAKIIIYADEKQIKEININSIQTGFGRVISLSNIWISKINVAEIKFVIEYNYEELDKDNNEITLEIKK